jgi:predicted transcriptional regulator
MASQVVSSDIFLSVLAVYVQWRKDRPVDRREADYFKIGELAALVGMSTRTIRYYEEIGLQRLAATVRIAG